jgi:hypothetical protein
MSKIFTPFSLLVGFAAGQVASKIFAFIWSKFDDEEAPDAKFREIDGAKLVIALLIEGAIFKLVKGLTDHGLRHVWSRTVGEWPGDERPEPE